MGPPNKGVPIILDPYDKIGICIQCTDNLLITYVQYFWSVCHKHLQYSLFNFLQNTGIHRVARIIVVFIALRHVL